MDGGSGVRGSVLGVEDGQGEVAGRADSGGRAGAAQGEDRAKEQNKQEREQGIIGRNKIKFPENKKGMGGEGEQSTKPTQEWWTRFG